MNDSRFEFKPSTHTYTLDGKKMTGVTTVLNSVIAKPMLIQWAADMACDYVLGNYTGTGTETLEDVLKEARLAHRKKKEKAAGQGTSLHAWVELWVKADMKRLKSICG